MYRLDVTLYDEAAQILQSKQLYIQDLETAKQLVKQVELPDYSTEDIEAPDGRIVTPLPPDRIHSSEGIVTPKLPIEVERSRNKQISETPAEHTFILVDNKLYNKIVPLIADPNNVGVIRTLLAKCERVLENPVPEADAEGIFWEGDLILKVDK